MIINNNDLLENREEIRKDRHKAEYLREDPIFYNEELDMLLCYGDFCVLLPEKYGWVEIGEL